jgi:hypothetical protein
MERLSNLTKSQFNSSPPLHSVSDSTTRKLSGTVRTCPPLLSSSSSRSLVHSCVVHSLSFVLVLEHLRTLPNNPGQFAHVVASPSYAVGSDFWLCHSAGKVRGQSKNAPRRSKPFLRRERIKRSPTTSAGKFSRVARPSGFLAGYFLRRSPSFSHWFTRSSTSVRESPPNCPPICENIKSR